MLTLNETRTQLRVGRRRLMLLLDELQIKPVQVHAKRQEITPEQFQQLQQHLHGAEDHQPDQTTSTSTSTDSSTSSTSDSTAVQPVVELLDHQPTVQTAEPPKEFEDIEEEIQQVDPVIATAASRSSRVGWIAISVCAISALGWVISQLPSVGEDFGRW